MQDEAVVVVQVPLTMEISVSVPHGAPGEATRIARDLAYEAARSLGHVSHAAISAFNETNRVYHHGASVVTAVQTHVDAPAA